VTDSIVPDAFPFDWALPFPTYGPAAAGRSGGHPKGFDAGDYFCGNYSDIDSPLPGAGGGAGTEKREATLHKIQQLLHDRAVFA
jgi:hypothetical protein